jgi:nucleoside-diphosphate-sugar epimerase
VVHAAGIPRPASRRTFHAVHVGGTATVVQAAQAAGVSRMVNIASQAVLFNGRNLVNIDETHPYPTRYIDPYSETKAEAERLALEANDPLGLSVISLRPAVVWGPGDTTVLPIMIRLARSPMGVPMCGDGSNMEATTYIENLVDAVVAALDAPALPGPGRAYFITDGFVISWKDFLASQLMAAGVRPRFRGIPASIAVPAAWTLDRCAETLRLPVPLALFGVRTAMTSRRFNTTRARTELGYSPRIGLEEGLNELRDWFRRSGGRPGLHDAGGGATARHGGNSTPAAEGLEQATSSQARSG